MKERKPTIVPPGLRITMHRVAKAAGVSAMTVSNTFRYPHRVQEATRSHVLKIAAELGYVPNIAAGALASGHNKTIGAVIPSMKNSSFYKYVRGMQDAAKEYGYELILTLADSPDHERNGVQTFIGFRVAGIALVGSDHCEETIALIRKSEMPVVESWVIRNPVDMAVGYSMTDATRQLTRYLIEGGRRRIGFIGYQSAASQRFLDRLPAFRDTMGEAGLASDLIKLVEEADGFGGGSRALEALWQISPDLDALICPTDIVAAGALFECGRRGWSVPGQIAIAGWGDYEIAAETTPGLTTIEPHAELMGRVAVSMIVERIEGACETGSVRDTGFRIVPRASA